MVNRAFRILLLSLFIFSFSPLLAWGNEVAGLQKEGSVVGLLLRLILSLVLIVGLIYGSLYLLKRTQGKKSSLGKNIEVLERSFISPKKGIFVVKVLSKVLVLGVTESSINCLAELNELPPDKTNPDLNPMSQKKKSFLDFLQEAKSKISLPFMRNKDAVECH
jgi:flagellar protein FliO/FliZ